MAAEKNKNRLILYLKDDTKSYNTRMRISAICWYGASADDDLLLEDEDGHIIVGWKMGTGESSVWLTFPGSGGVGRSEVLAETVTAATLGGGTVVVYLTSAG